MTWIIALVFAGGVLAVVKIWLNIKKAQAAHNTEDFDTRLIARLRAEGSDPFKPHDVDFFLSFPDASSAEKVREQLAARGYVSDVRATPDAPDFPFGVHVAKSLQLSLGSIQAVSTELGAMARAAGGRYDGWAAAHVSRTDSGGIQFRDR